MELIDPNINDDALLLNEIAHGNKQAFNMLFHKHWPNTYSDAYKRLKNKDDAKDVVQEIFTHIWINRKSLHIENLRAYFYVAIRNKVIKLLAQQKPTHAFFDILENISERSAEADRNLLWKEFLNSYEALLKTLPPKRQEIFRLRYQENLSTKTISSQMGITRKTVQNQLAKALASIKVTLLHLHVFAIIVINYIFY